MSVVIKGMITIVALIIVMMVGFLLSRNGKPYSNILFTIHKVVALAAIIYSYLFIKQHNGIVMNNSFLLILLAVTVVYIFVLFITGALLSIGKVDYMKLKHLHLPVAFLMSVSVVSFIVVFIQSLRIKKRELIA